MALTSYITVGLVGDGVPDGARAVDDHHPASVAFRAGAGRGALWVEGHVPVGRGMGFSGAVRVGGLVAAHVQRDGPGAVVTGRARVLAEATRLEGHADNVAASLLGGVVATAGGRAVRVPLALDPAVVVWVPSFTTSTDESRRRLPDQVPLADAAFNIGHTALLVAALAAGDVDALRVACQDRLHQDVRLAAASPSRAALDAALRAGAWCAWLSGSGPTVAALCARGTAPALAAALPSDGRARVLSIDPDGAAVMPRPTS
jgi:homoserine kinase